MNVVLDTNVFVAGVFFSGPPATILRAWREGRITLVVSPPIMDEYRRVMHELATQFPAVDPGPPLELLAVHARLVEAPPLPEAVCTDPTDDMFLACAIAGDSRVVVSGDRAPLRTSGYRRIEVIPPRDFLSGLQTSFALSAWETAIGVSACAWLRNCHRQASPGTCIVSLTKAIGDRDETPWSPAPRLGWQPLRNQRDADSFSLELSASRRIGWGSETAYGAGVVVPDLPACVSAGRMLDEALDMAREAIELHIEGLVEEGLAVAQPGAIQAHQREPAYAGGTWAIVTVQPSDLRLRSKRVNISMPERVLEAADRYAARTGETRSGLLVRAVSEYMGRSPVVWDEPTRRRLRPAARRSRARQGSS